MAEPAGGRTQSPRSWRFEFPAYEDLRRFLDALAAECEHVGFYPNISFHRRDATVTLERTSDDGASEALVAWLDAWRARAGRSDTKEA